MAEATETEQTRLREQDLISKVAVVTGGSKGIGRATALNLASRGCSVICTCSADGSLHLIDTMNAEIDRMYSANGQPGKVPQIIGITANIFSPDSHMQIADAVETLFGHLDIIILNAGATGGGGVGSVAVENIQRSWLGGIQAPVMTVDELVKRRVFREASRIVFISSVRARVGNPGAPMYAATKSAMQSVIRSWADAFGGQDPNFAFMAGTTANSVQVGLTKTDAVMRHGPEALRKYEQGVMPSMSIPRIAEAGDVADVVGLLVGREARWITGSVVAADGGTVKIC